MRDAGAVNKMKALRALLISTVPGLATKPENLSLYAAKGRIATVRGETMSFEYRFTATIMVQDYAGDPDNVFVPLVAWVAENQTELTRQQNGEAFSFEVDELDSETRDIEVSIDLTETVRVVRDVTSNSWQVTHIADVPMIDAFPGIVDVKLSGLLLRDLVQGVTLELPEPAL